jgi:RNA polymerase sigma-70 factor (ECF subfamily)
VAEEQRPSPEQREFAERLLREHGSRLRAIARRNSINADDAEEALQRTLLIALRADPGMPGHPLAWATTVLKREAWGIRRERTRRIQQPAAGREEEQDQLAQLEAKGPLPDEAAERAEHVRAFRRAFDSLKPQEREVLLLIGAGLSYQEIEERMGYRHTKINRCVAEGRAALRERMSAWEREGTVALEDLHNLKTIEREPTRTLLRRREALLAARRADARRTEDVERTEHWHARLRARLEAMKAQRLALEATGDGARGALLSARAREREAREALVRFGGRRGSQERAKSNRAGREEALVAIEAELASRREMVVLSAVRYEPAYVLEAFGPRPEEDRQRAAWCRAVDRLVALRQLHGITDSEHALGEQPDEAARRKLEELRGSLARETSPTRNPPARDPGPELAL